MIERNDSWPACGRAYERGRERGERERAGDGSWQRAQTPTYRVPDLELDLLLIDGDHASAELDADRQVVHGLEALVGELEQQA